MFDSDNEKIKKGYVWFWRSFIDWEWFTEVNTCHLFQYCILRANHSDTEWRGIAIKRGSFITSLDSLAVATGLTTRQVRTAIKNLKKTNEIEVQTTSRYSIITVKNYNLYQNNDMQNDKVTTNKRQTSDKQTTTDNNEIIINNNEEEEGKISTSSTSDISDLNKERIKDLDNYYGEYKNVHLNPVQLDALKTLILNDKILNQIINNLSENIETGKEKLYDEKTPAMHYIRLKKYWQYLQNKQEEKKQQVDEEYNFGIG